MQTNNNRTWPFPVAYAEVLNALEHLLRASYDAALDENPQGDCPLRKARTEGYLVLERIKNGVRP